MREFNINEGSGMRRACIAFAARESSFARTVWLESGTAGEERERLNTVQMKALYVSGC